MAHDDGKFICDGCGADLTTTGNSEDYRLVLGSQVKKPWYAAEGLEGGAVTDVHVPDPLGANKHFCGFDCLRAWLAPDSRLR